MKGLRDFLPMLERELERWPGVVYRVEHGSKHDRIVLEVNGSSRFIVTARTPSDHRADRNRLMRVRHALREIAPQS